MDAGRAPQVDAERQPPADRALGRPRAFGPRLAPVLSLVATALITAAGLLAAAAPASAAAAPAAPALSLSSASGPAGTSVTATGSGFACSRLTVDLTWDQATSLGSATVTGTGFSASFAVPSSAAGAHTVAASCPGASASAGFSVVVASPTPTPTVSVSPSAGPTTAPTASVAPVVPTVSGGPTTTPVTPGVTPSATSATPSASASASANPTASAEPSATDAPATTGATSGGQGGSGGGGGGGGTAAGSGHGGGYQLRSAFARALPTPAQLLRHPGAVAAIAALALLFLPLIGFAAELFHKTVHTNRATLRHWFGWARPFPAATRRVPRPVLLGGFLLLSTALTVLVEPGVGANGATAALVFGFLVAIPLGVMFYAKSIDAFERRETGGGPGELEVLPGAAVAAVGCALLSWGAAFNPGYVYGLIAEYRSRDGWRAPSKRGQGAAVLVGTAVMLATALVAWLLRSPVASALSRRGAGAGSFVLAAGENVLVQVVVGAVVSAPIVLLPIHFMDGRRLWEWSRPAWAAAYGAALVMFAALVLDPTGLLGTSGREAWLRAIWLFGGFAVFSVLFWAFFRFAPAGLLAVPEDDLGRADTEPLDPPTPVPPPTPWAPDQWVPDQWAPDRTQVVPGGRADLAGWMNPDDATPPAGLAVAGGLAPAHGWRGQDGGGPPGGYPPLEATVTGPGYPSAAGYPPPGYPPPDGHVPPAGPGSPGYVSRDQEPTLLSAIPVPVSFAKTGRNGS